MDPTEIVTAFWDTLQRRAWSEVRGLLADDVTLRWPVSGESIRGAEGVVRVNAIYPEGWTITVDRVQSTGPASVLSIVRVDHPPHAFYAVSLFEIADARIRDMEEYWSTVEEPPAWRTPDAIPGYARDRG